MQPIRRPRSPPPMQILGSTSVPLTFPPERKVFPTTVKVVRNLPNGLIGGASLCQQHQSVIMVEKEKGLGPDPASPPCLGTSQQLPRTHHTHLSPTPPTTTSNTRAPLNHRPASGGRHPRVGIEGGRVVERRPHRRHGARSSNRPCGKRGPAHPRLCQQNPRIFRVRPPSTEPSTDDDLAQCPHGYGE